MGFCNTWHYFGQDEGGFQLSKVELFKPSKIHRVQGKLLTRIVYEIIRHCLWNAHEEVPTWFPIKFFHSHTEEESENNTQTESGCTQGRGRGGTRPHGRGHTTQRDQSEGRSERYKRRRDREKGKCWWRVKITWTRAWERTVEEYAEGKDWCGRRGWRTKTG